MPYGDNDEKMMLRLPGELKKALDTLAKKAREGRGLTLSEYVRAVLEEHVGKQKGGRRNG